jgi:hypothetical protein
MSCSGAVVSCSGAVVQSSRAVVQSFSSLGKLGIREYFFATSKFGTLIFCNLKIWNLLNPRKTHKTKVPMHHDHVNNERTCFVH